MDLPPELWLCIARELRFRDLVNLTLSCTRCKDICSDMLRVQRIYLKKQYRLFDTEPRREQAWPNFMNIEPTSRKNFKQFIFLDLLLNILKGCLPATYILGFEVGEPRMDINEYSNYYMDNKHPAPPLHARGYFTPEDDELIREAVESSPWILKSEVGDYIQHIRLGSQDAVLCILIPLLSNLRYLGIPFELARLENITRRIAGACADSNRSHGSTVATIEPYPLSMLSLIHLQFSIERDVGLSLDSIVPYAALPSVRRLLVSKINKWVPYRGWPRDLPLSKASEVYFDQGSLGYFDARSFARGFERPCVIRQIWRIATPGEPPDEDEEWPGPDWDYGEFTGELDSTGRVMTGKAMVRLKIIDDGEPEIPDYMYAWCPET